MSAPPALVPSDANAIDVQLRESDLIQYYHGTVCLLQVQYHGGTIRGGGTASVFCQMPELIELSAPCPVSDAGAVARFAATIQAYLPAAAAFIDARSPQYYANQREGYWQNRLALAFGRNWQPGMDWLVIDREAVIGFEGSAQQSQALSPAEQPYLGIRRLLQEEKPGTWGQPSEPDSLGNECDLLALGPDGELICIELKHGANASGIYWGPLQVCNYRDQFRAVLPAITSDILRLVKAKIQIGLLPATAGRRLPTEQFRCVQGILAVAEPADHSGAWARLSELMTRFPAARVPVVQVRSDQDPGPVAWAN
jgi:hypothetical protein